MGVAVGIAALGAPAHADEPVRAAELGRARAPVLLELAACLEPERDAIQRAVRVELGGDPAGAADARAVVVRVECAAEGVDAGIVLEVRPPGTPRRYRYALDWREQPLDARPRLLGLAVTEAVDASRIELVAVSEPAPPPGPGLAGAPAARAPSDWTLALFAGQRAFSPRAGVDLSGAGLMLTRRLSPHLRLGGDLMVEAATALTGAGAISVRSASIAPRIAYRAGGRIHGELGLDLRLGVVGMQGEVLPHGPFVAGSQVRAWLGPAATAALGADLTPSVALIARFELGLVAVGATARDRGEPAAVIGGTWTSLGLAAAIGL